MSDADTSTPDPERDLGDLIADRIPFCDDCGEAMVPGHEGTHNCESTDE
ncbi:MAG: hypothetical protein SV760_00005 [Halobacteria archaeon]|nr:hypothetical protein [Halobacteria archaeon]